MASVAHVTDMVNTVSIPINGATVTVRQALSRFFASADVTSAMANSGKRPHLVNFGPVADEQLDRPLAAGDTITLLTAAVADGGVKGAYAYAS